MHTIMINKCAHIYRWPAPLREHFICLWIQNLMLQQTSVCQFLPLRTKTNTNRYSTRNNISRQILFFSKRVKHINCLLVEKIVKQSRKGILIRPFLLMAKHRATCHRWQIPLLNI